MNFYRFQQALILIAHLVLLRWIFYTLSNAGHFTIKEVTLHFFGMALFGAFLIRITAFIVKRHELQKQAGHSID